MPLRFDRRACACHHDPNGGFAGPGSSLHYPPDLELEPIHLDIDVALQLDVRVLSGTVTLTVRAGETSPRSLNLDAVSFEDLSVTDPDGKDLTWRYDGERLSITWADTFGPKETRRVAITYRVEKPMDGLHFSGHEDAVAEEQFWVVTDHETERARHWLPTIDHPSVRPTLDFHLSAPADLTILANGALQSEKDNGDGTKTAHWSLDHPCPSYITCFAIGDFIRVDEPALDGVEFAWFTSKDHDVEDLRRTFRTTRAMMEWMTQRLDSKFPFAKYYQFAVPGIGGAMENISLTSWDDVFICDETLDAEWSRVLEQVNVHEMAHTWFGDAVVCRDFAHAWLKESWATYMEQCWFEDSRGEDEARYEFQMNADAYFQEANESYKRPIVTREFQSSWQMYDRHLYPGGSCRLHTLRNEIGDQAFWAGVRDYLSLYMGKTVETDQFRQAMEARSGRSLVKFFDQWFKSAGHPEIEVSFEHDEEKKLGTFEIKQTQVDESAGAEPFELRTEVAWVINGELMSKPVHMREKSLTVVIPMDVDPDMVRFDPAGKVLHALSFNPGSGKLKTQLREATDITGRILAARELAKTARANNVTAILEAWDSEAFYGVKCEWAAALAKSGTQVAIDGLRDIIGKEQDPRVLAPLLRACIGIRDNGLRDAVVARLGTGELGHRAQATALEVLGSQREAAPFELIAEAAGTASFGGHAQCGALRALAATRSEAALPLLLDRTERGATSFRARHVAVTALGTYGRYQTKRRREQIVERLVDLLRDPDYRVKTAAVGALASTGASEAIGALEAHRDSLAAQDRVAVDAAVRSLRRAPESGNAAAQEGLDAMTEKVRKLEGALEKLRAEVNRDADA